MTVRTLVGLLGAGFTAALIITAPAFAYYSDYEDGYFDPGCDNSWAENQDDLYSGYRDYGYSGSPDYYGGEGYYDNYNYGYEHPSGFLGYWGKDAEHHRRGHWHHHWF